MKRAVCFCIILLSCVTGMDIAETDTVQYDGFMINEDFGNVSIRGALDILKQNRPDYYICLKRFVRTIEYSIYYRERSYPFYDTIYVSTAALERGVIYGSSVILHELCHIVLQGVRKNVKRYGDYCGCFPKYPLTLKQIKGMKKSKEEKFCHTIQFHYLEKYGSKKDREYQKMRIKALDGLYGKGDE